MMVSAGYEVTMTASDAQIRLSVCTLDQSDPHVWVRSPDVVTYEFLKQDMLSAQGDFEYSVPFASKHSSDAFKMRFFDGVLEMWNAEDPTFACTVEF